MSNHDERDLSAAFEELRAPASTAHYATRTPGLDVPSARSPRWPQALAGVVAVAVAVAGAGTFLALRNARQAGSPASAGGHPPARWGATMAFDSTTGMTVMFGGSGAAGQGLTDTWTWDGSAWTAAAKGPGSLVSMRMVDDPAAGGVLLLGVPAPAANTGGALPPGGCVSGSGASGGGSASTGSGSSLATVPPGTATGAAGVATPAVAPAPGTPAAILPVPSCPPVKPATEQTWLFSGHAWNLASSTSVDAAPAAGAQLAYDPTTKQVVAVSSNVFSCGPPLESATSGAAIACPMMGAPSSSGTASNGSAMPAIRCAVLDCGTLGARTWTWSGRSWTSVPAATAQAYGITLLFDDPATNHVTLMAQSGTGSGLGLRCPLPPTGSKSGLIPQPIYAPSCPPAQPLTTTWTWTGSAWHQVSQVPDSQAQPSLAGASVAAVAGHVVVLTAGGDTWTFAAGQWTQATGAGHPSTRYGAAAAQGPSETVVLFGGADSGVAIASGSSSSSSSAVSVGSDTWVWNGTAWRQDGGTAPSPPPVPSCAAMKDGVIPPCVGPPTNVSPATAIAAPPQTAGASASPAR